MSSRIGFDSFFGLQLALLGLPRAHQSLRERFKTLSNTYKISHTCACCNRLLWNSDFWWSIKRIIASIKRIIAVEHQKPCFCTVHPSKILALRYLYEKHILHSWSNQLRLFGSSVAHERPTLERPRGLRSASRGLRSASKHFETLTIRHHCLRGHDFVSKRIFQWCI